MVAQALGSQLTRQSETEPDVGHGTHLAVYFRCNIKAEHIEGYGHQSSDAREGVNL
jgi:hypothetical protein